MQANQQAVVAGQVNAVGELVGKRHGEILDARVGSHLRAALAIEHEQRVVHVHGIDELLIGGQETVGRGIVPDEIAGGPVKAIHPRTLRRDVDRIVGDPRLLADRAAGDKAPENFARDDVQGIDAIILGGDVGNFPMAAEACRDRSVGLEGVKNARLKLRDHEEQPVRPRLEEKVGREDGRLFDACFRTRFGDIVPEVFRLRAESLRL